MNIYKAAATLARLFLTITLLATPLNAQRRRPSTPKPQPPSQPTQPAPTFESVLAADTYRVYGEVRGVGQLLRSSGVNDILGPLVKLASPPKEFKTLVKWLDSQADTLMSSRLMIAAMPSRPNLPQVLLVIEFDSAEEAQKFAPLLRGFVPKLLPTPVPASSPESSKKGQKADSADDKPPQGDAQSPPPPRFVVKQAGPLVFLSETTVSLKALRPAGSKLLMEDNNFRQAHSRFSSESIFLYVDVAAFEKEDRERRRVWEEEERKRIESEAANPQKAEEEVVLPEQEASPAVLPPNPQPPAIKEPKLPDGYDAGPTPNTQSTLGTTTVTQIEGAELSAATSVGPGMVFSPSMFSIFERVLFSGPVKWPEALGVGINFEADSYVVRALLINDAEVKGSLIPFFPNLVSGPPVAPEAPSILPADTELLVTASLDYLQIYDGIAKAINRDESIARDGKVPVTSPQPESPFAAYEAKLGIKIREDLLPLLGNEIAVSVPLKSLGLGLSQPPPTTSPSTEQASEDQVQKTSPGEARPVVAVSEPQPVVAISVRDKETLRILIPKIIDNIGFKGASMLAQTEKRGDTELVSYGNALSYAFIGNFLVASPDVKSVRQVVDSYLNHQTLASDARFRDATRWQPRAVLGQVYMPTELMEAYLGLLSNPLSNQGLQDFVSQLSPTTAPVTYAVSNEGLGPLHELHLPKNLVMFMIAGMVTESSQPPMASNEAIAKGALRMLLSAETVFQADKGKGSFGSLEQLAEQGLVYKDLLEKHGYKIELIVSGTKFEATAVPLEYGKTGVMSFFIDESGVLRGADRGGAPASLADKPVN